MDKFKSFGSLEDKISKENSSPFEISDSSSEESSDDSCCEESLSSVENSENGNEENKNLIISDKTLEEIGQIAERELKLEGKFKGRKNFEAKVRSVLDWYYDWFIKMKNNDKWKKYKKVIRNVRTIFDAKTKKEINDYVANEGKKEVYVKKKCDDFEKKIDFLNSIKRQENFKENKKKEIWEQIRLDYRTMSDVYQMTKNYHKEGTVEFEKFFKDKIDAIKFNRYSDQSYERKYGKLALLRKKDFNSHFGILSDTDRDYEQVAIGDKTMEIIKDVVKDDLRKYDGFNGTKAENFKTQLKHRLKMYKYEKFLDQRYKESLSRAEYLRKRKVKSLIELNKKTERLSNILSEVEQRKNTVILPPIARRRFYN